MRNYNGLLLTLFCFITVANGFVVNNDCQTSDPQLPPISPCIIPMEWAVQRNDTTDLCRMYNEAMNCIANRTQSQACSFQQILTHYETYIAAELTAELTLSLKQCTVKEEPVICSDPGRLSVFGFNVCRASLLWEEAYKYDECLYITLLKRCVADQSANIGPKCSENDVTAALMSEGR